MFENEVGELLLENRKRLSGLISKKVSLLEEFIIDKLLKFNKDVNKISLQEFIHQGFAFHMEKEMISMFSNYSDVESKFYHQYMKTVDLIFNTVQENKIKVIYLENVIKKIENREINPEEFFERSNVEENDQTPVVDELFTQLIESLSNKYKLTGQDREDIIQIVIQYQETFKKDIMKNLKRYSDSNKKCIVDKIVLDMDKEKIRGNKTREEYLYERALTENAKKISDRLLTENVKKHKEKAKIDLTHCSTNMIDLIFELLPDEYKNQRQLLEIIVDTDINERIGNIIEEEASKLEKKLSDKNKDIIQNELYEEKRYKQYAEYDFNYDVIDQVYRDVVHEIRKAYDIPEDGYQAKKLDFSVLAEENSTKNVIRKLITDITLENNASLKTITDELNHCSQSNLDGKTNESNMETKRSGKK